MVLRRRLLIRVLLRDLSKRISSFPLDKPLEVDNELCESPCDPSGSEFEVDRRPKFSSGGELYRDANDGDLHGVGFLDCGGVESFSEPSLEISNLPSKFAIYNLELRKVARISMNLESDNRIQSKKCFFFCVLPLFVTLRLPLLENKLEEMTFFTLCTAYIIYY